MLAGQDVSGFGTALILDSAARVSLYGGHQGIGPRQAGTSGVVTRNATVSGFRARDWTIFRRQFWPAGRSGEGDREESPGQGEVFREPKGHFDRIYGLLDPEVSFYRSARVPVPMEGWRCSGRFRCRRRVEVSFYGDLSQCREIGRAMHAVQA